MNEKGGGTLLLGSGKSSPAAFLDEGEAKKSSRSSAPFAAEAAVEGLGVRIVFLPGFGVISFWFEGWISLV